MKARRYFQLGLVSRDRGDLQKITRSFVYARQFSRFRIQSVTNSERRRNSGRCGFSSELANAALRRRIQIRSSYMWLPPYTYVHIHTPRLPPTLLPFSRASRPKYTCPFLSTRYRPRRTGSRRNECAATHDRSGISFDATGSFTPFREEQGNVQ